MNLVILLVVCNVFLLWSVVSCRWLKLSPDREAEPAPIYWYRGPNRPREAYVVRPASIKIQRHKKSPSLKLIQQIKSVQSNQRNEDKYVTSAFQSTDKQHYIPRPPISSPSQLYYNFTSQLYNPYYPSYPSSYATSEQLHHPYAMAMPDYEHNVFKKQNNQRFKSSNSNGNAKPRQKQTSNSRRDVSQVMLQESNRERPIATRNASPKVKRTKNIYVKQRNVAPNFDVMDHYDGGFGQLRGDAGSSTSRPTKQRLSSNSNSKTTAPYRYSQDSPYDFESYEQIPVTKALLKASYSDASNYQTSRNTNQRNNYQKPVTSYPDNGEYDPNADQYYDWSRDMSTRRDEADYDAYASYDYPNVEPVPQPKSQQMRKVKSSNN